MKKAKRPPAVAVDWVDSATDHGWSRDWEDPPDPLPCHTIGYLVGNTRDLVRIAASISIIDGRADAFCNPITIPRCAVKRIRRIKL